MPNIRVVLTVLTWSIPVAIGVWSARSQADDLKSGPGSDLVASKCSNCHELDHVIQIRKNRSDWDNTVSLMQNYGMDISEADKQKVIDYLAANYGFAIAKPADK